MKASKIYAENSLNLMMNGELSVSDSLLLDQLEVNVLEEYNQFVEEIINLNNL